MWRTVREAFAVLLGFGPKDEAPGHERRTALIVLGVMAIAAVLVMIAVLSSESR